MKMQARWVPPTSDILTGVQAIAAGGDSTCALMTSGGVRCWGNNSYGQLGDGTTTDHFTPPGNDALTGVQAITAGRGHTCALTATGSVQCWGDDSMGQLGNGTTAVSSASPTHVLLQNLSDELTGVQAIAGGGNHTCALMTSGGVRCWGDNSAGQLGDGTTISRSTPSPTDVLTDVKAIATGYFHTCALMETGRVRCWGANEYGQLGSGPMSCRATAAPVIICQ